MRPGAAQTTFLLLYRIADTVTFRLRRRSIHPSLLPQLS
jgi:hypothetical protein